MGPRLQGEPCASRRRERPCENRGPEIGGPAAQRRGVTGPADTPPAPQKPPGASVTGTPRGSLVCSPSRHPPRSTHSPPVCPGNQAAPRPAPPGTGVRRPCRGERMKPREGTRWLRAGPGLQAGPLSAGSAPPACPCTRVCVYSTCAHMHGHGRELGGTARCAVRGKSPVLSVTPGHSEAQGEVDRAPACGSRSVSVREPVVTHARPRPPCPWAWRPSPPWPPRCPGRARGSDKQAGPPPAGHPGPHRPPVSACPLLGPRRPVPDAPHCPGVTAGRSTSHPGATRRLRLGNRPGSRPPPRILPAPEKRPTFLKLFSKC